MNNETDNCKASTAPETISCPRCQGTMVQGWVMDSGHAGYVLQHTWLRGTPPLPQTWAGQVMPPKEDQKKVYTYRCSLCGYLESYAH